MTTVPTIQSSVRREAICTEQPFFRTVYCRAPYVSSATPVAAGLPGFARVPRVETRLPLPG